MLTTNWLEIVQDKHNNKLILTGLAALQYPAVQTKQLTFFNPSGNKEDYYLGPCHVLIKRSTKRAYKTKDHLIFIAKHIDIYSNELDQLISIISEVSLKDFQAQDKAWRIFAYLKLYCLNEQFQLKKSIGRRYIDLGDITNPHTVTDSTLYIRDALLVPNYKRKLWKPIVTKFPKRNIFEESLQLNQVYFKEKEIRALFHQFSRYASRLESSASAKIEGYDAQVEEHMLSEKIQKRLRKNISLQANLNMDNLHRNIKGISNEALTLELLLKIQNAIVYNTWKNKKEKIDKTPGHLRTFDEVIVDKGTIDEDNVIYVAPKYEHVEILLRELIDFYHTAKHSYHPLDLASIFHCQLVVIHPFGDGNGRLARWCFLFILIQLRLIDNVHQAPISQILLEEKNRYYKELAKVDEHLMQQEVNYSIDKSTQRYIASYSNIAIYKTLNYNTWLEYIYDVFNRTLQFSIDEHEIFERTRKIYKSFQSKKKNITIQQHHEISRAIDIGLKKQWGKKTEKRLVNNGISADEIKILYELILKNKT